MNSPREIDTALAAIYEPYTGHVATIEAAQQKAKLSHVTKSPKRQAELARIIEEARAALAALEAEAEPLEAIYRANPWTRFFLVPGGHLHRSRSCSSFRWTTPVYWLPEYSGKTEAEIVALAGEKACTICYPSAPVNRPSQLPVHVAERAAAAAEAKDKAAKRQAAAAATITVGKRIYKTARAAENDISRCIDTMVSRRYSEAADAAHRTHLDNLAAEDKGEALAIADALAEQIEGYDAPAVLAKKFATKAKEYRKYGWAIPADATF
ncbi:hypothetical protein [Paenarthrobacter sp. NPDC090522]|uniref:hypothetical protein n=1 Tax=Paenarthrobacter sp. NPDC090522 TaxID=3364383 RepID=UPI0037F1E494